MQPLRQQAHLIGRLPLKLLFQQNRPICAGRQGPLRITLNRIAGQLIC
uniref:Uncharacterized protein n=1 Tax=Klebsiella pneumoniae TaxID=573 RepID=A0A2R4NFV5_KLEPN|nr:hypothetical protein [Klebsiella pneumoniae]QVQ57603.1 hypothetical protein [Klebsiella pneumoniae]UMW96516.1 hypothetical protein [Raoultella ornithinolytica]CQR91632.1 hypothetical protein BN1235_p93 [Acinetobacter baumannii]